MKDELSGSSFILHPSSFIIVRLGPNDGDEALKEPHIKEFDITVKPMKNWNRIEPEGIEDDDQLAGWIQHAVKFVGNLPAK